MISAWTLDGDRGEMSDSLIPQVFVPGSGIAIWDCKWLILSQHFQTPLSWLKRASFGAEVSAKFLAYKASYLSWYDAR